MSVHSSQINSVACATVRWRTMLVVASCFYLLTCSGRMGSADAYTQLQAAVNFVHTGFVSTDDPMLFDYCSVPSPSGRYYQAHDPGNLVLFIPSAVVAVALGEGEDPAKKVPLPGRVSAALTYALVGAGCLTAIYVALCQILPPRAALATTALAGCGTPLWIYTRCTMDVLPAALGVAVVLAALLARAGQRISLYRAAVLAAVGVAFAGWFRASTLPFIAAPALMTILWNERAHRWQAAFIYCSLLIVCFAPVLGYNLARSGNPFVLGTMHPRYDDQNGFSGDIGTGLYGLLLSPNHGLFVFAPWLLIALYPKGLRGINKPHRTVIIASLLGAIAYTVMIAALRQWAKVEWGPRYLVPFLPVIVVVAAVAARWLWETRWWPAVAILALLSLATTLPAGLVNYSYVVTEYPDAANPLATSPAQIIGTYRALIEGVRGRDTVGPLAVRGDPERSAGLHFPDLLIARLFERSAVAKGVGLTATVVLLLGLFWGTWSLLRRGSATVSICIAAEPGAAADGGALRFFGVQRLTSRRAGERCL